MIHVICRGNNKVLYIVNVVFLLFVIYYLTSNRQKQSYKIFIWAINSSFVIKQRIKNELCTITKYNKNVDSIEISAHDGQLPALIYRHCHITSLLFYHFQLIRSFVRQFWWFRDLIPVIHRKISIEFVLLGLFLSAIFNQNDIYFSHTLYKI